MLFSADLQSRMVLKDTVLKLAQEALDNSQSQNQRLQQRYDELLSDHLHKME